MISSNPTNSTRRLSDDSSQINNFLKQSTSASKALQAYIEHFNEETTPNRTPTGCYASSTVSSLLSSKPKAAFSPATLTNSPKKDMNLVEWVNASYAKDLCRQVVPYGSGRTPSIPKLRLSDLEDDNDDDERSVWSDPGLSTLPSPSCSVVSLPDSHVESTTTDQLLHSFHKKAKGRHKKASVHKNYPSWVDDLTGESDYPSWLDDIDNTQLTHNGANFDVGQQNLRNRLSRSLSPSFFRRKPKLYRNHKHTPKRCPSQNEAWELESTNTEMLISQSIYGNQPVNMGGTLHSPLYCDKKIQQLCEESFRKIGTKGQKSPIQSGPFDKARKNDKKNFHFPRSQTMTYSQSVNHHSPSTFLRNTDPLPKKQQHVFQNRRFESPRVSQKPSKAMRNLKLSLQERKISTDSSNTDKLMRLSPTGIHMTKREDDQSPRNTSNSTIKRKVPGKQFLKMSELPENSFQRRQASDHLSKLIKLSEKNFAMQENQTKQHLGLDNQMSCFSRTSNTPTSYAHSNRNILHSYEDEHSENYPTGKSLRTSPRLAHSLPRSTPRLRTATAPDQLTERLRHASLTDRRNRSSSSGPRQTSGGIVKRATNLREYEETESVNTETLVVYPPMPLFDASPSLTTESGSTVGSDYSESTLIEQEALKTSFRYEAGEKSDMTSSSTSYKKLMRTPRDWERDYKADEQVSPKPGIITSFLEDCLSSTQESELIEQSVADRSSSRTSSNVSDRPVETLKKILFTVQSLTQSSEDENQTTPSVRKKDSASRTGMQTESEELFSDINLNEIPDGNTSLSRAYYHLSRLKNLVSVSQKVAGLK